MENDDEWGLSAEELDQLEQNAMQQIARRRLPQSMASAPSSSSLAAHSRLPFSPSPANSPQKQPLLKSPIKRQAVGSHCSPAKMSKPLPFKVFKDRDGKIGVETAYCQSLIASLKTVPGHEWDANRRVWMFPENNIGDVLSAASAITDTAINVEAVPPLRLPSFPIVEQVGTSGRGELHSSTSHNTKCTGNATLYKSPRKGPRVVVHLFQMQDGRIAAQSPYHEGIKLACQSVSGRIWNAEERAWTFPSSSLEELVHALMNVSSPLIKIEADAPLVLPTYAIADEDDISLPPSDGRASTVRLEKSETENEVSASCLAGSLSKHVVRFVLHSSGLIAAKFEYNSHLLAIIKTVPKVDWHPKERSWMFPSQHLVEAERILHDANVTIEHLEPLVARALKYSASLPNYEEKYHCIPSDLEMQLMPFQRDGIRFALKHGGRVLIADEMGLGKTLQAIAIATCFEESWPVLVIVPSSLRLNWATMLKSWLRLDARDITVVLSQSAGANKEGFKLVHPKQKINLDGSFNIISYDIVSKVLDDIVHADFKMVIADESHYLKNAQAKRTNACVPLIQKAQYAVLLTGTPALSRPIELFKQLEAIHPSVYRSVQEYGHRYCSGGFFGVFQGCSNHEELHALMKATVMIRRLKREVLKELPQKRRQQILLTLDSKDAKQIAALFAELESIKRNIKSSAGDNTNVEQLVFAEKQLINKIYTESAAVKVPSVQDYLSTVLEADCKFLVFAHHQLMMDAIQDLFVKRKAKYIRIDGSTPAPQRQNLVSSFQENESVRAALLGIRAAGLGLTLTAASTVIFAEMSWTPGDLVQAEDRAHRIGQVSSVNVYYLHACGTIDDIIWDAVHHKLENLGQVLDGRDAALHVASPPAHHQSPVKPFLQQTNLKPFLRPCNPIARNLALSYDASPATENQESKQPIDEHNEHCDSKRPRVKEVL